jgi:DNA-binding GntR family transcriptional regulator
MALRSGLPADFDSEALQVTSLREQALSHVRGLIVSGRLSPGSICTSASLAERLGISATPVREAMLELVTTGLLEPMRAKGFRVVSLTERDLEEIIELRKWLEVPALVRISESSSPSKAVLADLADVAAECTRAVKRGDVPEFLALDRAFHLRLLGLADNRRLVDVVARLRDQTRLYGIERRAETGQLDISVNEHAGLIDAIKAKDGKRTRELATAHIEHARRAWAPGQDTKLPSTKSR